jgi:hypothetical protein
MSIGTHCWLPCQMLWMTNGRDSPQATEEMINEPGGISREYVYPSAASFLQSIQVEWDLIFPTAMACCLYRIRQVSLNVQE